MSARFRFRVWNYHWLQNQEGRLDRRMPDNARVFWENHLRGTGDSSHVVTCYESKRLVGFLRFDFSRPPRLSPGRRQGKVVALGTWVDPARRGLGLGLRLWERMLDSNALIGSVRVVAVSAGGRRLVRAMQRLHPGLHWQVQTVR